MSKFMEEERRRIPGQQVFLRRRSRPLCRPFRSLPDIPAHIAHYFAPRESSETGDLFCGDTLFAGGCGRLFEGSPAQMVDSPSCGFYLIIQESGAHEYTLKIFNLP